LAYYMADQTLGMLVASSHSPEQKFNYCEDVTKHRTFGGVL